MIYIHTVVLYCVYSEVYYEVFKFFVLVSWSVTSFFSSTKRQTGRRRTRLARYVHNMHLHWSRAWWLVYNKCLLNFPLIHITAQHGQSAIIKCYHIQFVTSCSAAIGHFLSIIYTTFAANLMYIVIQTFIGYIDSFSHFNILNLTSLFKSITRTYQ
jgi:hypothetical protein